MPQLLVLFNVPHNAAHHMMALLNKSIATTSHDFRNEQSCASLTSKLLFFFFIKRKSNLDIIDNENFMPNLAIRYGDEVVG